MNDMQWALLIISVLVVLGIYLHARRQAAKQAVWNNKRKREGMEEDQLDFFQENDGGFDEFGVGKARTKREAPKLDDAKPARGKAKPEPKAAPAQALFVISVHRSDLSHIPGDELHQALQSCGLEFGAHDIYHRFSPKGDPVFSVASVVKPGFLIPGEQDDLRTPGVSLFLQLPGPLAGDAAFDDLLTTAQTLAERFDATLLDRQRQPLDAEGIARMQEACAAYSAQ